MSFQIADMLFQHQIDYFSGASSLKSNRILRKKVFLITLVFTMACGKSLWHTYSLQLEFINHCYLLRQCPITFELMDYRKVYTSQNRGKVVGGNTHIDNFSVRSKRSDRPFWQPKQDKIHKKQKVEEVGRTKQFIINGVDFHKEQVVVQKQGQVLEDAFSVKGHYFYLKQGDIVNIRYAIGDYVEVRLQQKIGYFPARVFRLIQGERWKEKSHPNK